MQIKALLPIPKLVVAGLLSAIAVFAVTGILRLVLPALAASETKVAQIPNVSGNCNNFGNYNVNCNTFNYGPVPRHLGDADKQQLLNWIPKDRKVSITFQGTESDAGPLAQEIYDFLQSSGYTMTGPPQGAMIITPSGAPQGVQVNLDKDHPQNPVGIVVGIRKN